MKKYCYPLTESYAQASCYEYSCGAHTLRLDFLDSNLLRIALFRKDLRLLPTWSVCPGDSVMSVTGRERLSTDGFPLYVPKLARTESAYEFRMDRIRVRLSLENLSFAFFEEGRKLFADRPYCAYNLGGELGEGVKHCITSEENEQIYGLGEKSGDVNRYGRSFTLGARDPMGYDARSTDPLYKHIPFYICRNSVGSYGIFYDTHAQGSFDFGREIDNYYGRFKSFSCQDDALVYYVFFGDIPRISQKFAWLCGRCAMPPKWSLDYCGSTMAYTEAPNAQHRLLGFLDECGEKRIRCSGFYLSSGYSSREGRRYVFTWNRNKIPNPRLLCDTFQKAGVHLLANIKPAFLTDHPLYSMLAEKGYFLCYADGSPALMPFWDGFGSYLDFTNPGAFAFWTEAVTRQLLEFGVDSTWNDNNEFHITDRQVYAHGFGKPIPAYRICQVFPLLMVMASHRAQRDAGQLRPMLSTRSGGAGLTRLAQTWTGDNRTAFSDLRYNHKMAMGMSLSGIFLFGHDLGGFDGPRPDPELFLRWLQYGCLMPRFCIHSWNRDGSATEPWTYPEQLENVQRIFAFRQRIKPFLYDLVYRAHRHFRPVMAPVFYEFPGFDPESDQFLLGSDVMACCVFDPGVDQRTVTLPETGGGWYSGEKHYAPGTHPVPGGIDELPLLFHRAGSIFAEDTSEYFTGEPSQILFTVYPLPEGRFTQDYFDDDGETDGYLRGECIKLRFSVECGEETVSVSIAQMGGNPIKPSVRLIDCKNRALIMRDDLY